MIRTRIFHPQLTRDEAISLLSALEERALLIEDMERIDAQARDVEARIKDLMDRLVRETK